MPVSFQIDVESRVVFNKIEGRVTGEELIENKSWMKNDPTFDPSVSLCVEYSNVTDSGVSTDAVRDLANTNIRIFRPSARLAYVAESDLVYGMLRMSQIYSESDVEHFRIFRSMAEARQWLGLD